LLSFARHFLIEYFYFFNKIKVFYYFRTMQADLTESVQASIRPGEMVDLYYVGETNCSKQAYPTIVNNKFVQAFTNLGAGSSQFIISPNMGVSDIVVYLQTPAAGTTTGLALNTGWGYAMVSRLSVRYGSSAQYFWSGAQLLLQNLMDAENNTKVDALLTQGGQAVAGAATLSANAYLYLKLPHNSCRASGKPLPFSSDLLVQPIVITIEMLAPSGAYVVQAGGSISTAPSVFATAQLQVKQEMLTDSSDLLARRVDMNSHAYTFPLPYFCQQETQIASPASAALQSVNLTGFRAGEVRDIVLWLTLNSEQVVGTGVYQGAKWYPIGNLTLTYNGEIFSRFDAGSGQLWNLVSDEKANVVNASFYTAAASPGTVVVGTSPWTICPFSQVNVPYDREVKLAHGKPILNAVVNLTFTNPEASGAYTLHAMYIYNASLLCSRGSSDYIF
jgi:hypothetical protein